MVISSGIKDKDGVKICEGDILEDVKYPGELLYCGRVFACGPSGNIKFLVKYRYPKVEPLKLCEVSGKYYRVVLGFRAC